MKRGYKGEKDRKNRKEMNQRHDVENLRYLNGFQTASYIFESKTINLFRFLKSYIFKDSKVFHISRRSMKGEKGEKDMNRRKKTKSSIEPVSYSNEN